MSPSFKKSVCDLMYFINIVNFISLGVKQRTCSALKLPLVFQQLSVSFVLIINERYVSNLPSL